MYRTNKYRAKKVLFDGIKFDSQMEFRRYKELKALERQGHISGIEPHPPFQLLVNGIKVAKYIADYRYKTKDGKTIIEDVKGMKTPVYRLKKKMVEAQYRIEIIEITY